MEDKCETTKMIHEAFVKLNKALIALEVIIYKPMEEDRSNIDASTHRFKFTIELFWKLLKRILESKGIEVIYPKDVLKEAFAGKLINDEKIWLNILVDRNQTSHTYDEELADKVYNRIKTYYPVMKKTTMLCIKNIVNLKDIKKSDFFPY